MNSTIDICLQSPTNEKEFLEQREYRLNNLKNCGVYIIQNTVNNKLYVGSSRHISKRFSQHKWALRNNKHHNPYLQNAWNKYGENSFEFYKFTSNAYPEKILCDEHTYIKWFNPEYNINQVDINNRLYLSEETKKKIGIKSREKFIKNPRLKDISRERFRIIGLNSKGRRYSDEIRKRMSESRKGKCHIVLTPEIISKIVAKTKKPIYQYDLNQNFIKRWESRKKVAQFYGSNNSGNFSTAVKKGIKLYNSYWKND